MGMVRFGEMVVTMMLPVIKYQAIPMELTFSQIARGRGNSELHRDRKTEN